ncbi:MAG TPA: hypothetical protein [Caudoviricetes sp.]|nr:MAG TPA: hypothetical protein [Caudoviricetes sp.]
MCLSYSLSNIIAHALSGGYRTKSLLNLRGDSPKTCS